MGSRGESIETINKSLETLGDVDGSDHQFKRNPKSRFKRLLEKKWFVLFLIHSTLLFMQITWASNTLISKCKLFTKTFLKKVTFQF